MNRESKNLLFMKKFLVIIPVYNEENAINEVARKTVTNCKDFADIVFINDGSSDNSTGILNNLKTIYPFLEVIHKSKNEGYGSSLITGFNLGIQKKYEFMITMDCDDQHQPEDLLRFYNFDSKIDVVSGSRYMPGSNSSGIPAPKDRVEINQRITLNLNDKYSMSLTDSFCGYKRYRTERIKNHDFSELGYAFPMEFWAYSCKKRLAIQEIPVNRIYVTDDRSFGEDLDKKRKRYKYYLKAWQKAHTRYFSSKLFQASGLKEK